MPLASADNGLSAWLPGTLVVDWIQFLATSFRLVQACLFRIGEVNHQMEDLSLCLPHSTPSLISLSAMLPLNIYLYIYLKIIYLKWTRKNTWFCLVFRVGKFAVFCTLKQVSNFTHNFLNWLIPLFISLSVSFPKKVWEVRWGGCYVLPVGCLYINWYAEMVRIILVSNGETSGWLCWCCLFV